MIDTDMFDIDNLVGLLLRKQWHRECSITVVKRDNRPYECFVKWEDPNSDHHCGLRYSKGPAQGFFWDVYGDNMQSPELALLALSQVEHPDHWSTSTKEIPWPKKEKKTDEP